VLLKILEGHDNSVNDLAATPDGRLLASAGADSTIRLWALPRCRPNWCLFDRELVSPTQEVRSYRHLAPTYRTVPCGTPIPEGWSCVCDCVVGNARWQGSELVCVCDTIAVSSKWSIPRGLECVCDTVAARTACLCDTVDIPQWETDSKGGSTTTCTCDTVTTTTCTCDTVTTGHYWYPT